MATERSDSTTKEWANQFKYGKSKVRASWWCPSIESAAATW